MQAVSDKFLEVCRRGGVTLTKIELWRSGARVVLSTSDGNVPVIAGSVTDDSSRPGVRRTLTLTTQSALWDELIAPGTTLKVYRGWRYVDGTTEYAALGVFTVDVTRRAYDYGPDGEVTLTCPDLWAKVQRARFEAPRTGRGAAVPQAVAWAIEAVAASSLTTATSTVTVTDTVYDRDRSQAILDIASAAGCDISFNATGVLLARDAPTIDDPVVWTANSGELGVLLNAATERSVQRVYNVIVVSGADIDGSPPFPPVVLADTDPNSPTYAGEQFEILGIKYTIGGIGRIPYFFTSPLILTPAQALDAAQAIFARVRLPAVQMSFTQVVNPALETGDVVAIVLPDGTIGRHLLERITTPLDVSGVQQIVARSTRTDESGGE